MKNILAVLFLASVAFAQSGNDPQSAFEKQNDKLVKKTFRGYVDGPDPEGTLTMTRVDTYKNGDKVSTSVEQATTLIHYYEHDYDEKGRPKERRELEGDRKVYGKFTYTYADDGSYTVKAAQQDADGKDVVGAVMLYSYDAKGLWMSVENVTPTGLVRRRDNEYDVAGKLITSTLSSKMGETKEVDEVTTYSYDAAGLLKKAKTVSGNGLPMDETRFDRQGSPISYIAYDGFGEVSYRLDFGPEYKDGLVVRETWKFYFGDAETPRSSGYSVTEYEFVK